MKLNDVPNVVAVASGKGGVGKTTVASDLARVAKRDGLNVGLMDIDISTPNSPEVLAGEEVDMDDQRLSTSDAMVPPVVNDIQVISKGIVLPDEVPLLRDGTFRAKTVIDYIQNVEWKDDTDIVVVDTPPGTGEELQSILSEAMPDFAFAVTTPHPSALRDVKKTHGLFDKSGLDHKTIVNMTAIPGSDVVEHILDGVDLTDVNQVGDSTESELIEMLHDEATDYNLFGFDPENPPETDVETVATVPYAEDFETRAEAYTEALQIAVETPEVEA